MQIKTTMKHHISIRMENKNDDTKCQEEGRKTETPFIAGGNTKWHSHFGKVLQFLTKLNIQVQLYSLVNRNKNRCVYKNLYVSVYSTFIKIHPNTETIQLFFY